MVSLRVFVQREMDYTMWFFNRLATRASCITSTTSHMSLSLRVRVNASCFRRWPESREIQTTVARDATGIVPQAGVSRDPGELA
jgi:hypothetical protein